VRTLARYERVVGASHAERDPRHDTEDVPYYTHARATPLTPGAIYKFEIPLQPMAYRFRKGNRIRLEICNGDSPVTDSLFFHFYRPDKIGTDTIYHGAAHPSQLILPVLDADWSSRAGFQPVCFRPCKA